jgi:hypothetical protein
MLGAKTFDIFLARKDRMEEALERYLESVRRNSVMHECKNAQRAEEAYARSKVLGALTRTTSRWPQRLRLRLQL